MQRALELIHHLADGEFHSGEAIGQVLGVSRSAVWKQLHILQQDFGLEMEAVKGKGYRLIRPIEMLDRASIEGCLSKQDMAQLAEIEIFSKIDSTNDWLMQQAARGAAAGSVCLAEQQLRGKGRHGRRWVSPFGSNIYLSLLWRFAAPPVELAGLSLAAAVGVLRCLQQIGCAGAGLKWPNDILWRERKLAGLLLEVAGESSGPSHIVIGVGLNTYLGSSGGQIDQPWVDLDAILGQTSRNQLAAKLIANLLQVIRVYQDTGLDGFIQEWQEHDLYSGKQIEISCANQLLKGRHMGIDKSGAIQLMVDGSIRKLYAGEVSLRRKNTS